MAMKLTRFRDIPRFPIANYSADMPFDWLVEWIDKQSEAATTFELNPDFQRGHVWTRSQQSAWLEYMLKGGVSGRDVYFNHPGWMSTFKGSMVCVDGLQRVTAVTDFVNDKVKVFGSYRSEYTDVLSITHVSLKIHVAILKTRAEVLKWYIDLNSGGTDHRPEEIEKVRNMYLDEIEM